MKTAVLSEKRREGVLIDPNEEFEDEFHGAEMSVPKICLNESLNLASSSIF